MRTFWIVQGGIAVAAIGVSAVLGVACSSTSGGTGSDTGTGTPTDTETETETETETGTETGWEPGVSCHDCACVNESSDAPAGCADACDNKISGASSPDFCNGAPALMQCQMCIMYRCGESDPTQCD